MQVYEADSQLGPEVHWNIVRDSYILNFPCGGEREKRRERERDIERDRARRRETQRQRYREKQKDREREKFCL